MKYNTLGKTNLKVSAISFGGIPIQRDTIENAKEVVDKLEEYGMNYIDTARGYTVSEEYIGAALKGRREKFIIATKSTARDYESMKKDVDISLSNLQTDYIDVYQFHNAKAADIDVIFSENGAYKALKEAKENKKIGFIGATFHNVGALKKAIDLYGDLIDTVMFPYNIVEVHGEEVLLEAKAKGIATIAMKSLAGGNLENYDLALRFIEKSGVIDVQIPGMGNTEEVDKNAAVLHNLKPLSEEEKLEVLKIREDLGSEFCRRCGYCLPCTVGIDIPSNFVFRNYLVRYEGLADWARKRFNALNATAKDCIECGECEARCPYDLPIIKMLKEVAIAFN